ncbi:MAG: ATP-binding protein [Synergistaceae bacterium]|jgi:predicted AAA+ superfamily ATPase|nr:ATP-binding protein [Synergistaceae bacterium]
MLLERNLMRNLIDWRSGKKRKPLILEGARQVGKTYILEEFGRRYYKNTVYVNMENASGEIKALFSDSIDPKKIIAALELMSGMKIRPDDTLIFFDEIQELPRALTSLKYFYESCPQYNLVSSGSLLGLFIHAGTSFPVGKVDFLHLEPMNFEEFLIASGQEKLVEQTKNDGQPLLTAPLKEQLNYYLVTGGMPEVVASWIESRDLKSVEKIQNSILLAYLHDFSKHTAGMMATRIRQVWESLASQFAKRGNKFIYGLIKEGARAREYELAIQWLVDSGVVRKVYRVDRGDRLPLEAYKDVNAFKLYFVDVGLFRHLAKIPASVILNKNAIFDEFNGLIAEQYVLQELAPRKLFFWDSGAASEVDFVVQLDEKIVPIEVKSGENVKAKSLRVYRDKFRPEVSIRFSLKDFHFRDGLFNIPLYMSFVFNRIVGEV